MLYGVDANGNVYSISTTTAAATLIGNGGVGFTGAGIVGLSDAVNGNPIYAGGNNQLYSLSPATTGATSTALCTASCGGYATSGDVEFAPNGSDISTLYLTSTVDGAGDNNTGAAGTLGPAGDFLWSISTTTGVGTLDGTPAQAQFPGYVAVFGTAYDSDNGIFYGYDAAGDEFDIDTTDPNLSGSEVAFTLEGETDAGELGTSQNQLYGAAFTSTPEPGSMALIGFGMLGLGLIARRRRNK